MYEANHDLFIFLEPRSKDKSQPKSSCFDDCLMIIYYDDIVRTPTKGQESMQPQMILSSMLSLVTMLKRTQVHDDDEMRIMLQQINEVFHDIPKESESE